MVPCHGVRFTPILESQNGEGGAAGVNPIRFLKERWEILLPVLLQLNRWQGPGNTRLLLLLLREDILHTNTLTYTHTRKTHLYARTELLHGGTGHTPLPSESWLVQILKVN